mgnify:CR=1 FL=1
MAWKPAEQAQQAELQGGQGHRDTEQLGAVSDHCFSEGLLISSLCLNTPTLKL